MPKLTKSPSFDSILEDRSSNDSSERPSFDSINTMRPLDDSYISEKQKMFKSKGKHNLASLGAKIQSTAASVGAHGIGKRIDSQQSDASDTISLSSGITLNSPTYSLNQPLKSKMFKQSRPDLKNLKIKTDLGFQAARTSLERSPMTRGGTAKELDRIASIGLPGSPSQSSDIGSTSHLHLHHPHLSFRKRDNAAAILSSSASNSTLGSEGTLYSFNIANNTIPDLLGMQLFKTVEEGQTLVNSSWSLLQQKTAPVFRKDEVMRTPIEDINIVCFLHLKGHCALGCSGPDLLKKYDDLLVHGIKGVSVVSKQTVLTDVVNVWKYFHNEILVILEACFLPLQAELDGCGYLFPTPQTAFEYWQPTAANQQRKSKVFKHQPKLTIKRKILEVFRNTVVVPNLPQLKTHLEFAGQPQSQISQHILPGLLQCISTMLQLKLNDEHEPQIEELKDLIKSHF